MKLNWSKKLFFFIRRRRKSRVIGHDLYAICRSHGRYIILDGLCVSLKSSRHSLLTTAMTLKKINSDLDSYYVNFPIYLTGALKYKLMGLTYGYNINCSRLVTVRLK